MARLRVAWASGQSSAQLSFVDAETAVGVAGQHLKFVPCSRLAGEHSLLLHPGETSGSLRHSISLMATCPRAGLFAYTELALSPVITICSYPSMEQVAVLKSTQEAVLRYLAVAFCRSGNRLASLSEQPDPVLSIWRVYQQDILISTRVTIPFSNMSFNPGNENFLSTWEGKWLLVWEVKLLHEVYVLNSAEVLPADSTGTAGEWTCATWAPGDELFAGSNTGAVVSVHAKLPADATVMGPNTKPVQSSSALVDSRPVSALLADAKHAIVGFADSSIVWFAKGKYATPLFSVQLESPRLSALVFAPDFLKILAMTAAGEAYLIEYQNKDVPVEPVDNAELASVLRTDRVGCAWSGGALGATRLWLKEADHDELVAIFKDGTLRCLDCTSHLVTAQVAVAGDAPLTCISTSADGLVAVGSSDGVLRIYKRAMEDLVLVGRQRLSKEMVVSVGFDDSTKYCAAACVDGHIFCFLLEHTIQRLPVVHVPGRPIYLGWTTAGGNAPVLLIGLADGHVLRMAAPRMGKQPGLDEIRAIKLPAPPLFIRPSHADRVPVGGGTAFVAIGYDRKVHVFTIGPDAPTAEEMPLGKATASQSQIDLTSAVAGAAKPTAIAISPDGACLAMGGAHGVVSIIDLDDPASTSATQVHTCQMGGVVELAFCRSGSEKGLQLLSVGSDGVVYALDVQRKGGGPVFDKVPTRMQRPLELSAMMDTGTLVPPMTIDPDDDDDEAVGRQSLALMEEPTLLDFMTLGATSGVEVQPSEARDAISAKVESIKERLNALIEQNNQLDDDDLEKLTREDFIVDLAQQMAWRNEASREVDALKHQIIRENLTNEVVAERMKIEFWDSMEAPSVTLLAMQAPGKNDPVTNVKANISSYTMPKQPPHETKRMAQIKLLRQVEHSVMRWEAASLSKQKIGIRRSEASDAFETPGTFGYGIGEVVDRSAPQADGEKKESKQNAAKKAVTEIEAEGEMEEESEVSKPEESEKAISEADRMSYSYFSLHTPWRKVTQMALHSDQERSIKTKFNVQFENLMKLKRSEMDRVKEKQARIKEVTAELARLKVHVEDDVQSELRLGPEEEPEKVLTVRDEEIRAPKFVSKEERERQQKLREEAEALARANARDNLGERGRKHMMNGTLEMRREEEEIFKDIIRPEWMDKPAEELTDEEKAEVKEFDAKVKKLEAEREKRCKALTTELQKLHTDIADICNAFNLKVVGLGETKMEYDFAVYESELLSVKLAQARLRKEIFEQRETDLQKQLTTLQQQKQDVSTRLAAFKKEVTAQQELVESLSAEDKALEKTFKRDFMDSPEFLDQLQKLYRRRKMILVPKGSRKPVWNKDKKKNSSSALLVDHKLRKQPSGKSQQPSPVPAMTRLPDTHTPGAESGVSPFNPPPVLGIDPFAECDTPAVEQVVEPLDAAVDMPEGLSFDVWDRLVDVRNTKVASEEELRFETAKLAEMTSYLTTLTAQDDRLKMNIAAVNDELDVRRESEIRASWNLELPFKLKQGQIEVEEAAVVTDFSDALLIHRSEVETLNDQIRALGAEKVEILDEIRNFRKEIVMLQWQNKRADMEAVDLIERTKEFQLLRVTKDLQVKIRGGTEDNQQNEVVSLERKLESIKSAHEDKMTELKRQIAKIDRMVVDKEAEMASLKGQIEQLEGSVLERKMIHEIQSKNKDVGDGYKRFEEVHMKRKLQTLVGMQTQEVELLREELDRLRQRTFPTFSYTDTGRGPF